MEEGWGEDSSSSSGSAGEDLVQGVEAVMDCGAEAGWEGGEEGLEVGFDGFVIAVPVVGGCDDGEGLVVGREEVALAYRPGCCEEAGFFFLVFVVSVRGEW